MSTEEKQTRRIRKKVKVSFTVEGEDCDYHSPVTGDRIIPFAEYMESVVVNEFEGYDLQDLEVEEIEVKKSHKIG